MLLLTDLTSAPENKSIDIEYCQKYMKKVSPILLNTNSVILTTLRIFSQGTL